MIVCSSPVSVAFRAPQKTQYRSALSVDEWHGLRNIRGRRIFAWPNINAAVCWVGQEGIWSTPSSKHVRIISNFANLIVSRSFIVTAAHCIEQAPIKDIVIYLGELDTQNSGTITEPLPAEKHRVTRKIIHPRFRFRVTQPDRYDLALLKMAIPTSYQWAICDRPSYWTTTNDV